MKKILFTFLIIYHWTAYAQTETTDTISVQHLDEIVVKGKKPEFVAQDGVIVVDLPNIVKDKPVTNILEALGYLPGVTSNDGMIWLTGASNVTILLNGELSTMPIHNLYQLLYTTPVERLKNVEIMYSAPAKFHVDGALINVVLKTPTPLDGLKGQARVGYIQSHYASFGGGLSASYAIKEWSFDLNYGLTKNKSWNQELTRSNHLFDNYRIPIKDDMNRIGKNWNNVIFTTVAWKSLKITYSGQIATSAKGWSLSSGTLGSYINNYEMPDPIGYHNVSLRYSAPFGLTLSGDYTHYSDYKIQSLFKNNEFLLKSQNKQNIDRYNLYLDQQHQLGKWQVNYGVAYQNSRDKSLQYYEEGGYSDFKEIFTEDVVSFYAGTQRTFDLGLSFNISAKGEYFHNNVQHNWNIIPQLGTTYSKTSNSIYQLNLNTRRVYPSYWELHGGISFINEYSTIIGNPNLQPYLQYEAQFNYILKQKYVATFYFQYGDKVFIQLPYQLPDKLSLIFQTVNINYNRVIGLNIYAPFNVSNIWNITATVHIFNQSAKADNFHDISFYNSKWICYGMLNNVVKLGQGSPISMSLDFRYISPSINGIELLSSLWRVDAGIKWQFGKKRCCELVLKADDIFNSWTPTMKIISNCQDYRMEVKNMTRNLNLTFVWKFNGFLPKDTSIDTSRFGTDK